MENSAKALYMAGSLLIALLVVSLLVYTFNNLGGVQSEKDKIEVEEDITKFNREYEAFNKKLMYGVDVISCINKAISNNEKYVKGGNWASAGASGKEAFVQVTVKLNNKLKESLQIYSYNDKNKETKLFSDIEGKVNKELGQKKLSVVFSDSKKLPELTVFDKNNLLSSNKYDNKTFTSETFYCEKEYSDLEFELLDKAQRDNNGNFNKLYIDNNSALYKLYKGLNDITIYAYNKETDQKTWSSIEWKTLLADFKSKKFTCTNVNYNDTTGRIDQIDFKEYAK